MVDKNLVHASAAPRRAPSVPSVPRVASRRGPVARRRVVPAPRTPTPTPGRVSRLARVAPRVARNGERADGGCRPTPL